MLGDGRQWAYEGWSLQASPTQPGQALPNGTPFSLVVRCGVGLAPAVQYLL